MARGAGTAQLVREHGGVGADPGAGRLTSLDGLRGLAALVVVLHHSALTVPALAHQWLGPVPEARSWWAAYTPLHLAWAGDEAVLLFFVLSGLVLSLPFLSGKRPSGAGVWPAYYRKRLLRLYLPVAAAVVLTGVVIALVPREGGVAWSWWMTAHVTTDDDLPALVRDAFLLTGTGWRNSVLWSMRIEVWFSILLPVFVVLVRGLSVSLWLSLPAVLAAMGWAASHGHHLLSHLCVFAIGVLLAQRLDTLAGWGRRIDAVRLRGGIWALIGSAGVMLLLAQWWLKGLGAPGELWVPLGRPAGVAGAVVVLFCFLACPAAQAFAHLRPLQWLGAISFSLYLVHEPVVVSLATVAAPGLAGSVLVVVGGLLLSLGVAVVFHRLVERPAARLAARAGHVRVDGPDGRPERSRPSGLASLRA